MTFDLERARGLRDFLQNDCAEVGDVWAEMIAEIERLRSAALRGNQLISELMANCNSLRARAWKAEARIKELEEALVEERAANLFNGTWDHNLPGEPDYEEVMGRAREEARAEIFTDAIPRSWQITDERKDAIRSLAYYLERHEFEYDVHHPYRHGCHDWIEMLRAMLQEAGQ